MVRILQKLPRLSGLRHTRLSSTRATDIYSVFINSRSRRWFGPLLPPRALAISTVMAISLSTDGSGVGCDARLS